MDCYYVMLWWQAAFIHLWKMKKAHAFRSSLHHLWYSCFINAIHATRISVTLAALYLIERAFLCVLCCPRVSLLGQFDCSWPTWPTRGKAHCIRHTEKRATEIGAVLTAVLGKYDTRHLKWYKLSRSAFAWTKKKTNMISWSLQHHLSQTVL